jgi:threonine dehydrogenase-like Zn-dependent dehydrogenase
VTSDRRALVFMAPGRVRMERQDLSPPGPADVIVRPLMVGITPDDFHAHAASNGSTPDTKMADVAIGAGIVMGTEVVGVVTAIGSDVTGVHPGDRVNVAPGARCGACAQCRTRSGTPCDVGGWLGQDHNGGLADAFTVPAPSCYVLPAHVRDDHAVLVHALSHALRAIRRSGLSSGDDIAIFGADDYGLATLAQARIAGAATITVVDPSAARREAALRLRATTVVDPSTDDVVTGVRAATAVGPDIVFVSLESYVPAGGQYLIQACQALRIAGRVVVLRVQGGHGFDALVHGRLAIPLSKEAHIRFVGPGSAAEPILGGEARGDWIRTVEQLASGALDASGFPLDVRAWGDLSTPDDFDRLFRTSPNDATKVVIRMDG